MDALNSRHAETSGAGDDNAPYNRFATWPGSFFSSLRKPHGNRGIDEHYWELRQSRIYLDDCFRGSGTRRIFTPAIPDPDKIERRRLREQEKATEGSKRSGNKAQFQPALEFAREQAKADSSLAAVLFKHCQRLGSRGISSEMSPSSSTSSTSEITLPSRVREEHEESSGYSDTESSSQIPGHAAISIDSLQAQVNKFAKENGFGVVRHNGSGSRVQKTRYMFQCEHGGPLSQASLMLPVAHNYRGVLELWKYAVFAETKEHYEKAWVRLCEEFNDQQAILIYLYNTYLPIASQWAHCFIKKYRNFGVRVTSGTEASNNNVKSYLLNGTSHRYGLVKAIEGMLTDQERDFVDNCSQDEVLTGRVYSGPGSEYLGELRIKEFSRPLVLLFLTQHLREPTSRNPYRQILDPKIVTNLRGRPTNTTQPVTESMEINQAGRECRGGRVAARPVSINSAKLRPQRVGRAGRQECDGRVVGDSLAYGGGCLNRRWSMMLKRRRCGMRYADPRSSSASSVKSEEKDKDCINTEVAELGNAPWDTFLARNCVSHLGSNGMSADIKNLYVLGLTVTDQVGEKVTTLCSSHLITPQLWRFARLLCPPMIRVHVYLSELSTARHTWHEPTLWEAVIEERPSIGVMLAAC
ncbi:hypothetical protein X797_012335 [Metarhizium robertsii]|uniref:Transposase n=1 Tax=Metarhizium robertsii TaxID=568076 RepID=A0A014PG89_9HYPO|nr:hypothetical protein X797_012335 [Metarhizium robertsii]